MAWGSGDATPRILNLRIWLAWVGGFLLQLLYSRKELLQYPLDRKLGGSHLQSRRCEEDTLCSRPVSNLILHWQLFPGIKLCDLVFQGWAHHLFDGSFVYFTILTVKLLSKVRILTSVLLDGRSVCRPPDSSGGRCVRLLITSRPCWFPNRIIRNFLDTTYVQDRTKTSHNNSRQEHHSGTETAQLI
jgi:hypothetical protein